MALRALSALWLAGLLCCSTFTGNSPAPVDAGSDVTDAGSDADTGTLSAPEVVASGEKNPRGIVLDAQAIYWQTAGEAGDGGFAVNGEIVRLARARGAKRSAIVGGIVNGIGLAADDKSLFWVEIDSSNAGYVGRVAKAGGGRQMFLRDIYAYRGVGVDDTNVFYLTGLSVLLRATKAGDGIAVVLQGDGSGRSLFVDASGPYIGAGGQILRSDSSLFAASPGEVTAMAGDAVSLYWVSEPVGKVLKLDLDKHGQLPIEIASGQKNPTAIAVGGGNVYWTNRGDGTVMRAPTTGGQPVALATGQKDPSGIAADNDAVVWTNGGDGTVVMCRRQ